VVGRREEQVSPDVERDVGYGRWRRPDPARRAPARLRPRPALASASRDAGAPAI